MLLVHHRLALRMVCGLAVLAGCAPRVAPTAPVTVAPPPPDAGPSAPVRPATAADLGVVAQPVTTHVTPPADEHLAPPVSHAPAVVAADLVALSSACGGPEGVESSLELTRGAAAGEGGTLDAFEENPLFLYAAVSGPWGYRRFFLLKPATFVIEEVSEGWYLRTGVVRELAGARFRTSDGAAELHGETLWPEHASAERVASAIPHDKRGALVVQPPGAPPLRSVHVITLRPAAKKDATAKLNASSGGPFDLQVTTDAAVFHLSLPSGAGPGEIEVRRPMGKRLLARRLLPASVLPHGPEGVKLLARWDAEYKWGRAPGWDNDRPSHALMQAIEDGSLKPPGRLIDVGCGTGTDAIYLAKLGFEVTAVDISPSALAHAQKKAKQAGVTIHFVLADVLKLPPLEPFDLVFDHACYHWVRLYNPKGYVEGVRRLSKAGTLFFLLAGSDKQPGEGGAPKVSEENLKDDFGGLYDFLWMRDIHFDRPDRVEGAAQARAVLMRRKGD